MDGCPRRGDPSFPGWIITLWLKFAFNCTALRVIPCCVDKSPPGSFAHSLCGHCPQTTVPLSPPPIPSILSAYLLHIRPWPAGGAVYAIHCESLWAPRLCPQEAFFWMVTMVEF